MDREATYQCACFVELDLIIDSLKDTITNTARDQIDGGRLNGVSRGGVVAAKLSVYWKSAKRLTMHQGR